jgi:hypothetical protein
MIFEDAHWTDPTSLEAFGRVVERLRNLRVLLIVTFRPEFQASWIGQPFVTALTINRLAERDIGAMIDRVVGNKPLPANIRQDIIERTDGIPLFVEEMTKAVLEAGSEGAAQRTVASIPSPTLAVPASLQASLMARLDRLGSAKEVAQIGAAIGREFSHALLAAVVSKAEPELASALERLIAAGLLFRQGVPPHASYLFKHALVQDAAYGTLLREPRRDLHARIADTLERQFTEIAENQPELLARHCTEAGLIEKAASLWGKAGLRSLERSALVEALEQLTRALDQLAALPATAALRREQIKLQVHHNPAYVRQRICCIGNRSSNTARSRTNRTSRSAWGAPGRPAAAVLGPLRFMGRELRRNERQGDAQGRGAVLVTRRKTASDCPVAHRIMGTTLMHTGEVARSLPHFDRAVALYDPLVHRQLATRFGQDLRMPAHCYRSFAGWLLGYPQSALMDIGQALKDAREVGQAATLMYALGHAMLSHIWCRNYAEASVIIDELTAVTSEKGAMMWDAIALVNRGCIFALTGKASDAIQTITRQSPNCDQLDQRYGFRGTYHIWQKRTRTLASSMMLGSTLAKR